MDGERFVAVEEAGVTHLRRVETGILDGDRIQIVSGVAPGDRVVVVGQRDLRDGQPLNVISEVVE